LDVSIRVGADFSRERVSLQATC